MPYVQYTKLAAPRFQPGELTSPDGQIISFNDNGCLHPGQPFDLQCPDDWVDAVRAWAQACCRPTRNMNHFIYGDLKPRCTKWIEAHTGIWYVNQGAIIAGLLLEGYCITQERWGSPNVYTNASDRAVGRPSRQEARDRATRAR